MAGNIKTFDQDVSAPRADSAGSSAFEMEGRHTEAGYAQAGNAIGGAITDASRRLEQHEALVETSQITNGFADLEMQTQKNLEAAKTSMDPHDTNAASSFIQAHQDALSSIGEGLMTKAGKEMYDRMQANYRVGTFDKVIGYQTAAAADEVVTNFKQGFDTRANLALGDPTSVPNQIEAVKAASAGLPAEHRASILNAGITQIANSGAEGLVNNLLQNKNLKPEDIETARAYLTDPKNAFIGNMSPGQYEAVNAKLDHLKITSGNVQSVINAQTLEAGVKQVEQNGGLDPNDQYSTIIKNYQGKTQAETAEFQAKWQRNLDAAKSVGVATKEVKITPDADLTQSILDTKAKLATAQPEQAQKLEETLKAVTEAQKVRDEAFKKDPADWVNKNNDVVGARYQQFAQSPTPQNFQSYAASSIAEQTRLYPLRQPRIVSDEMSQVIGNAVQKITNDPAGASAAGNILASYAKTAGGYWPQMAQELYKTKTLNANQFVAASLYAKPESTALAEEILRASVVPSKELIDKNIGNPDVTEAKVRAVANSAFKDLDRTMLDDRGETRIVGGYEQALTTLMLSRGTASSGDAAKLASKMINDEYQFKGTYRIPVTARVNADDVDAGLKSALGRVSDANSGIAGANLIVPPSYAGLGPNDQKRAYIANVQAQGHWVTNSNESGAVLFDEQNHPVWMKGAGGKPQMIGLDWKSAANHGVVARGMPGAAYKFIMGQQ